MRQRALSALFAMMATLSAAVPAAADEVVLRAISAFQKGTTFFTPFDAFVKSVNENGKGKVRINLVGGPDAMPPFEVGNALRGGVIDLANTTAVYHANLVPEGLAMTLTDLSMADLRSNGGYALLDEIHMKKANIHWLGRLVQNMNYHIYMSKYPDNLEFKGLKIRSAPTYKAFFDGLGIAPMQTAAGEVFTALERGTIDGYAWPSVGVFDLGWQEKTAARIDPGFYQVETGIYISGSAWKKLTAEQRAVLEEEMLKAEAASAAYRDMAKEEFKRQEKAGIRTFALDDTKAKAFTDMAQEEGWKPVVAASPVEGAKLRELFAK
ncbi:TRAP-type C4-dicarboxylate transport system substrate-binding protein [Rhizobium petrolearium]|uniref:TRAP transporter substrate-binding protein DctP n=1 Tax=Neorhizobium petrolearium TaxID=515361 RepID=UPI001AE77FD4|nr:TRAP transporter substrate-binding protein DctP [Neorhizobium petrolearium]MBP1844311.1 TRAP-type C4-dicarboxylate transport system substrate-binding protein [Neorhizobium petrolearium]